MDVTELARSLLESVPAHRTVGIEVQWAGNGSSEVTVPAAGSMANVIGSLHSGGLIALLDAAGLAAIIGACESEGEFDGVLPLGAAASVEFRAPARGRLVARCLLTEEQREPLRRVLSRADDRARLATHAEVVDEEDAVVCRGSFEWSVRRIS